MRASGANRTQAALLALLIHASACANNKGEAKPAPPPPPPPLAADIAAPLAPARAEPPKADPVKGEPAKGDAAKVDAAPLACVDLTGLDPSQIESINRLLDEKPSACGKGHSLRTSLKTDPGCKRSCYAGKYLVRLLKSGLLGSEAEEIYDKRFVAPEKGECTVDAQAPVRGNPKAPILLCEFSDFQCPHCKLAEPLLSKLLDDNVGQVRLVYKNYPITKLHPEARDAAAAAVAAGNQGKFWQMHDKLFENQDHLTKVDLEKYARELKLDVKKWSADLAGAKERVEKDHAEGEKNELTGTPTLYINGRKYAGPLRYEELKDWVDEELNR